MKYNILVTGTGAIIGYGIIESLRKSSYDLNIIAIDIYDHAYGRCIADKFYVGVPANSPGFIEFINGIIKKENIHLVIPGIEQDLYALHENFKKVLCPVVMNNDLCIELSKSKWNTFNYFKNNSGLQLIPTLYNAGYEECVSALGNPFLLKPISSYASKGIEIIKSKNDFDYFANRIENKCVFQKIISSVDNEYTISVFGDGKGNYFDSIILKRYLSRDGATSRATVTESRPITNYLDTLVRLLKPLGPTNIQLRIENEQPYLLEINPRISSACSIRTLFNYNEPVMCIRYYLTKEPIEVQPKKMGTALRFIKDYIVNE